MPLLPFGNPIGPSTLLRMVSLSNHFVPASRGGVYIESNTSGLPPPNRQLSLLLGFSLVNKKNKNGFYCNIIAFSSLLG